MRGFEFEVRQSTTAANGRGSGRPALPQHAASSCPRARAWGRGAHLLAPAGQQLRQHVAQQRQRAGDEAALQDGAVQQALQQQRTTGVCFSLACRPSASHQCCKQQGQRGWAHLLLGRRSSRGFRGAVQPPATLLLVPCMSTQLAQAQPKPHTAERRGRHHQCWCTNATTHKN